MKSFLNMLKVRAWTVFMVLHLGFAIGLVGLGLSVRTHGLFSPVAALWICSLMLMYGAFLMSGYFLVAPMRPVIERARDWGRMKNDMVDKMPKNVIKTVGWVAAFLVIAEVIYLLVKMWRGRGDSPGVSPGAAMAQFFGNQDESHDEGRVKTPRTKAKVSTRTRQRAKSGPVSGHAKVIPLRSKKTTKRKQAA